MKLRECNYCNKLAELRPYGSNGARICFECAMSPENKLMTEFMFENALDTAMNTGDGVAILNEEGVFSMNSKTGVMN